MGYVEINPKLLKKLQEIKLTDYEIVYERFLKIELVEDLIEALIDEIDGLNEKLEDTIRDRDENYRQLENREIYDYYDIQWWKVWGKSLIF